jgi:hypothetical protein
MIWSDFERGRRLRADLENDLNDRADWTVCYMKLLDVVDAAVVVESV